MKNVLILGGGVGGTIVANVLAKKTSPQQAKLTMIDASGKHLYQPGLIYVALGNEKPQNLIKNERNLLNKRVELLLEQATRIDTENKQVETNAGKTLDYDFLVIATGARLAPEELPGYEDTHHFYNLDSALKLKQALDNFSGGKVVVGVGGIPYKCPPAPGEFACQLDYYFAKRGLRDKADIHYLSPINRVFTIESISPLIQSIMDEKGITNTLLFNVDSIDSKTKTINSLEGESVRYDLAIIVPPHKGVKVVEDSGLGDRGGWIPTDKHTLKVNGHDDIYALGDATDIPTSKAGATAHYEAKVLAENLAADIKGEGAPKHYDGKVRCFFDAGFKRATTISFNYEHPPKPTPLGRRWYYTKMLIGKLYWSAVLKGWA